MRVTSVPANLILPPSAVPRSHGIHVSGIIRCIATEMGLLKAEYVEELSLTDVREIRDPVALLRISIGLAWEEYYIRSVLSQTDGVEDHPGEMQVDGIYMTCDGESVDVIITEPFANLGRGVGPAFPKAGGELPSVYGIRYVQNSQPIVKIHEVKATYKSTKTVGALEQQWMWMSQVKAYCKGKDTLHAKMHVLFLCGDYTFPITPQLRCWDILFTQQEIDANWDLLRSYRDEHEGK